ASSCFVWSESSLGGGGTAISVAEPRTHGFHWATWAPSGGGAAAAQVEADTRAASIKPAAVTENRCFIHPSAAVEKVIQGALQCTPDRKGSIPPSPGL